MTYHYVWHLWSSAFLAPWAARFAIGGVGEAMYSALARRSAPAPFAQEAS